VSGTACSGSGCPGQYEVINFNNLGDLNGYTIQTGDKLVVRQYDPSGLLAGAGFCFTDGSCQVSYAGVNDQDGYWAVEDGVVGSWHYRRINLSPMAGKVINNAYVDVHPNTSSGTWHMYFQDMALVSANGTVYPLLTRQNTVSMWAYGAGQTNLTYSPTISTATADVNNAAQTTYYYHGDQIGSSRIMTAGGGWPVWQGTFLPYGEEYNAQIGTNHYKFTGKERDDESGLDYFGARYYSNGLGRFITPDWAAKATAVPYADFADPQSLNLYTYVRNLPTSKMDADGHCTPDTPNCQSLPNNPVANLSTQVKQAINDSVKASDHKTASDQKGRSHEEGGSAWTKDGKQTIAPAQPGPYKDVKNQGAVTLDPNKAADPSKQKPGDVHADVQWHVHPSAKLTETTNSGAQSGGGTTAIGTVTTATTISTFDQPPSPVDIQNAAPAPTLNLVIGARDQTVYVFDGSGTTCKESLKDLNKGPKQ